MKTSSHLSTTTPLSYGRIFRLVLGLILLAIFSNAPLANARTWLTLCSDVNETIYFVLAYDQSYERNPNRDSKRYRAMGWGSIEPGQCTDATPIANGQFGYLAFRSEDSRLILDTRTGDLHDSAKSKYKTICVDPKDAFSISANEWVGIMRNCPEGYELTETSFGIRGGDNNLRIRLVEKRRIPLGRPINK